MVNRGARCCAAARTWNDLQMLRTTLRQEDRGAETLVCEVRVRHNCYREALWMLMNGKVDCWT